MTIHLSHGNLEVKLSPIKLDTSDTSIPKLPDAYMIKLPVKLTQTDVFAPRMMTHVTRVLKQDTLAEDGVIT